MSHITLSQRHGLQPHIPVCYYCNEEKNEVALLGAQGDRIAREVFHREDGEMPMSGLVLDMEPCDKCKALMQQGIIIISIRDGERQPAASERPNPYRTGGWWVVKDEAVGRMLEGNPQLLESALKRRMMFIEDKVCDLVGLVKEDKSCAG